MRYPGMYITPLSKLKTLGDEENPMVFTAARSVQKITVVGAGNRTDILLFQRKFQLPL